MGPSRLLLSLWPRAAWYAGALGNTVRADGCTIALPTRYLAGVARLGGYEMAEREAVRRFLPPHLPVLELGTGVGLVACVANKRLARPSHHWCIDGNPHALALAASNGRRNGCHFRTIHAAIAYDSATVQFGADDDHLSGGIGRGDRVTATPAIALRDLFERSGFDKAAVICDIEGGEQQLINREGDVLRDRVPLLILETHPGVYGSDGEKALREALIALGYRHIWQRLDVSVWTRTQSLTER